MRATLTGESERANVARLERIAPEGAEQGRPPVDSEAAPALGPSLDHGARAGVDPDRAPAVALAVQDGDRARLEVDVLRPQRERLADAQPGPVEDDDQGAVTDAGGRTVRASPDQGAHLVGLEDFGGVGLAGVPGRLGA